ncbi:MAG: FAD-binding protein [Paracoccaceae bacterium]
MGIAVLTPESEAELAEVVARATGPLVVQGGGTRMLALSGQVLSTAGLSGVTRYDPGALTIVAQAGTPVAQIEATLDAEGQRLAFEPMDHRVLLGRTGEPTIGGVVVGNVSGPRRVAVGACRDFLLGVRFVDGQGRIIKNGGRVMKNVTGYDLTKLMAGSFGTLGVLSEVSLKVLPKPDVTESLMLYWAKESASDHDAVRAMSVALGSPYEVTGAVHFTQTDVGWPITIIRVEGTQASVTYRLGKLRELLAGLGDVVLVSDPDKVAVQWRSIRDVEEWAGSGEDIWRISVKPTDAPGIVAKMPDGTRVRYDWGGGLIWAACDQGTDLRTEIGGFSGHATLVHTLRDGPLGFSRLQPEPAQIAAITTGLRQKFDPRGILNPGLMGP